MLLTLLPYLTVAGNLVIVLGVLLGVSQSVRRLRRETSARDAALQAENARLAATLNDLQNQIRQVDSGASESAWTTTANVLDGSLRTKALKMHRLGQAPGRIADTLRVPKGEVDLMVKVHQIVMQPHEEGAVPAAEKS